MDNASTDQTAQVALDVWGDFPGAPLRVVSEPRAGLSHARIKGFEVSQYEYVSFVDDDNWVAENWVETVFRIMKAHPEVGACGGKSEGVYEIEPPEWFHQYHGKMAIGEQADKEGDLTDTRGWLWGAGLTVRKAAWKELIQKNFKFLLSDRKGSQLSSGGDNEICYLLRILGWRLYYSPQLTLKHFIPQARISWEYLCKLASENGYPLIVVSRYNKFFRNNLPISKSEYLRHWISSLRALVYRWLNCEISTNRRKIVGSRDQLNQLMTLRYIFVWIRLGPNGIYEIDQAIRCLKKG